MKKSEIVKPKFPFVIDIRDYVSSSMFIENNHNTSNDSFNKVFTDKPIESSEKGRPFDLFGHILEG
jgi:hypothetical protein